MICDSNDMIFYFKLSIIKTHDHCENESQAGSESSGLYT